MVITTTVLNYLCLRGKLTKKKLQRRHDLSSGGHPPHKRALVGLLPAASGEEGGEEAEARTPVGPASPAKATTI